MRSTLTPRSISTIVPLDWRSSKSNLSGPSDSVDRGFGNRKAQATMALCKDGVKILHIECSSLLMTRRLSSAEREEYVSASQKIILSRSFQRRNIPSRRIGSRQKVGGICMPMVVRL